MGLQTSLPLGCILVNSCGFSLTVKVSLHFLRCSEAAFPQQIDFWHFKSGSCGELLTKQVLFIILAIWESSKESSKSVSN